MLESCCVYTCRRLVDLSLSDRRYTGMIAMLAGAFLFGMLLGTLSSQITAGNIADQEYLF